MENLLDEIEKPVTFTDKEIFTRMWIEPRSVLSFIHENKYDKYVTILLILAGISSAFDRAIRQNLGDKHELVVVIILSLLVGGALGWISYYIYSAMISWTGKWLEGKGNTQDILRVIAYAMTPSIIALLVLFSQISVFGNEMFKVDGDLSQAGTIGNIFLYGTMALELILGICTIVFCVIGVSEVQKITIGRTILNLLLPFLIVMVPILLLVLIFKGF